MIGAVIGRGNNNSYRKVIYSWIITDSFTLSVDVLDICVHLFCFLKYVESSCFSNRICKCVSNWIIAIADFYLFYGKML